MPPATTPVRLVLELEPGSHPVEGTLAAPDSPPQAFVGLLELVRLVDEHIGASPE